MHEGFAILKRPKFLIPHFSGCNSYHIRIVLNIDRIDWILIIVAMGLVLSFEAINTSIEFVVDLLPLIIMNMQNMLKI